MTTPTQFANAIPTPPAMVKPGYFTSIRPPSFRSMGQPASHGNIRLMPWLIVGLRRLRRDTVPPTSATDVETRPGPRTLGTSLTMLPAASLLAAASPCQYLPDRVWQL